MVNTDWSLWTGRPSWADAGTPERLVALPANVVDQLALRAGVLECRTWGEVREVSEDVYQEVLGLAGYKAAADAFAHFAIQGAAPGLAPSMSDQAAQILRAASGAPSDDAPFDVDSDVPQAADGDWPPSLFLLMNSYVPSEILDDWGAREMTVLNGEFAYLDPAHRVEVVAELTRAGFAVREDDRIAAIVERETWGQD